MRKSIKKGSQNYKILNHLKTKGNITTLEAFREYGCTRLSGRIFELKEVGYNIISTLEDVKTRSGETTRVAVYRLGEE